MAGLIDRVDPAMHSNWHSYGPLILFPQGWKVGAPDADDPIFTALAGTDANPAIPGFDPGVSAEELYVTNGETTDYADVNAGAISFTPELNEGCPGCGFVFPDDEALVEAEFRKTLPFSLSLARSADNPSRPETSTGMDVKPFYLDQDDVDPENGGLAMFDFKFRHSYGDPQEVRVLAKRSLGRVTRSTASTAAACGARRPSRGAAGEVYGAGNSEHYRVMRGVVSGTDPGDRVEVWFEADRKKSESFTYRAVRDTNGGR